MSFFAGHRLRITLVGAAAAALVAFWAVRGYLIHNVLPNMLHKQLTTSLNREVSFQGVNTNLITYFSVQGLKIARGAGEKAGTLVAVKELVINYSLHYIVLHPRRWANGIRKVTLIEPHVELAMEDLKASGTRRPKAGTEPPATFPAMPKTWLGIDKGSVVLTRRGAPVLEVKRISGNLNLRDLPHIDGSLKLIISPEATIAMNGKCHLGLKNFEGALSIEHLDLGQLSDLARMADPSIPVRVGGLLKAELEVQGGFMSTEELIDNTTGRGSLELTAGSIAYRGASLVSDAEAVGSLEEREIALERLDARVLSGALSAAGHLGNLGQGKLRLNGRLDKVPARALKPLSPGLPDDFDGQFSFEFSATGTGRHPMFAGKLTAPSFGVPAFRAEDVVAEAVYSLADVRLTNLRARLWSGSFTGGGTVGGLDGGEPQLKFRLNAGGIDVAQSPIGRRGYAGRGALEADLEGPAHALTGNLHVQVSGFTAQSLPVGDLDARARFERGAVTLDARTAGNTVAATGTIVLGPEPRCEGCRVEVQERLPQILAISGVAPPKGFDGRASGSIRIAGPLKDPVITAEAVASGVRIGKTVLGDSIRVPKFVFEKMTMTVPAESPMELVWGPEGTAVTAYGVIPVEAFARAGKVPIRFHCEAHGRLDMLKRLDLVKQADGQLQVVLDVAGTSSYPLWSGNIAGSGGRIVLKDRLFDRDIEGWSANAVMVDSQAQNLRVEVTVDKQKQVVLGRFGMNGWDLGEVDLSTETVSAKKGKAVRGLPLAIEGVADIRAKLNATLHKDADDSQITVAGPNDQTGADLVLSEGTIFYVGGGGSGAAAPGKKAAAAAPGEAAPSWFTRRVNFLGTVSFGRNVLYTPESIFSKMRRAGAKLLTDKEARRNFFHQFSNGRSASASVQGFVRDLAVEFDVRIKEGSKMRLSKVRDEYAADGELVMEPGSKISLVLPTVTPPFLTSIPFTLVDEPGKKQRVVFLGAGFRANVELTGETILFDRTLKSAAGEAATVDELHVRLILEPPKDDQGTREQEEPRLMNFRMSFASEPKTITGIVTTEATAPGNAPAAGAGGAGTAPAAQGQSHPVTLTPTQSDLFVALTGVDALTTGANMGSELTGAGFSQGLNLVLKPLKWLLGMAGIDLSVKKSDQAKRHQAAAATTAAAGGGGSADPAAAGNPSVIASALQNQEVTIGRALGSNFYLNNRTVLLDASSFLNRNAPSSLAATQTTTYGNTTQLEFRTSRFKASVGRRWNPLPDDPDVFHKFENFGKVEVNQSFAGVSQREPFSW